MKRSRRMLMGVLIAALPIGVVAFDVTSTLAHSSDYSTNCDGLYFRAEADYEGNKNNNTVTITIDGDANTYKFAADGISKNISWSRTEAHAWSIAVDANINEGDPTAYDEYFSGTQAPCELPPPPVQHIPVTLCHKDGQSGNYSVITTDDDGVLNHGNAGHDQHDGDIIPPFDSPLGNYPGKNWDAAGQAIFNNQPKCTVPTVVTATTPGVEFRDPSCANTTAEVVGYLNTDKISYTTTGTVAPGAAVTVTATPQSGFTFSPNPTVFQHTFGAVPDCSEHVTASVTFQDPTCANDNVAKVLGAEDTAAIDFTVTGNVAAGDHVDVTAVAKPGYTLDGTTSWSHTFAAAEDCRSVSVPVAPEITTTEECGLADSFLARPTAGVIYTPESGAIPSDGAATVVATPADSYRFAGDKQSVTFTFEGGPIENCVVEPPAIKPPTTEPPTTQPPTTEPPTTQTSTTTQPPASVTDPAPSSVAAAEAPAAAVAPSGALPVTGGRHLSDIASLAGALVIIGGLLYFVRRRRPAEG
jgi:LPXTG-motif cell wall-anchored protein